ncbi:hypothetical protein PISMIDRAFT_678339 [Pisolithus microcarpus 441]|uniref:Uncharacterized protein n=1 Tax=Pisolithus microcarpus 441 TaxID=765257 RepID=A0A0C9ZEW6_9AGAM|nr:hypothetical protein PISMIDRAFT_678339 [Pisolithus microcarpus 441]
MLTLQRIQICSLARQLTNPYFLSSFLSISLKVDSPVPRQNSLLWPSRVSDITNAPNTSGTLPPGWIMGVLPIHLSCSSGSAN